MQLALHSFKQLFPNDEQLHNNVERFNHLQKTDHKPRIAVFGKFNHGKSTLLNALVGHDIFATSDKRETVKNQEFNDEKHQVVWLDTPGLDADATGKDDFLANKGTFVEADIILLVHNLKAGELDRYEVEHFKRLLSETSNSVQKLLVITQIDEVPDAENRKQALNKIQKQFPQFELLQTSAIRYQRGVAENREKFIELSGIPILSQKIQQLRSSVSQARQKMQSELKTQIEQRIQKEINRLNSQIQHRKNDLDDMRDEFERAVDGYLTKVANF